MLAPARSGGIGGAVSALDAAWALQVAAGLRTFDADQTRACDVSGNGSVSTLDASYILQQVVGMVARVPVAQACGADFAFVPEPAAAANQRLIMPVNGPSSCQPGAVAFEPLAAAASGQNFRAIAFGDCTGNWQPPAAALSRNRAPAVRIGPAAASRRRELRVPIAAPAAAQALQLELRFDPARLRFKRVRTLGARDGLLLRAAPVEAGVVRIAAASATDLSGLRLVALFAPRVADASLADLRVGSVVVDETPGRAAMVGR